MTSQHSIWTEQTVNRGCTHMSDPVHQIGTHLAQLTTGAQLAEQLGQEWSQSLTTHLIGELPARPQQRRVFLARTPVGDRGLVAVPHEETAHAGA